MSRNKTQFPKDAEELNWTALAERLDVSRQTIYEWRRIEGTPKTPNVAEWEKWVEQNRQGEPADITEVKRLVEIEKLRKLKRENEIQEAKTIPMDEVTAALRVATAKWDSVLTSKLDQEAPARLVGKDIAETRAELAAIHDELREAMAKELAFAVDQP